MIYLISGKFVLAEEWVRSIWAFSVCDGLLIAPPYPPVVAYSISDIPTEGYLIVSAAELPSVQQWALQWYRVSPSPVPLTQRHSLCAAPARTPSAWGREPPWPGWGAGDSLSASVPPDPRFVPLPGGAALGQNQTVGCPLLHTGARTRAGNPHGAGAPLALWFPPLRAFLLRPVHGWKA